MMRFGVIADTHGYVDSLVFSFFEGVDRIIHAGDIGSEDVIIELEAIAPVIAVRGNMDRFGKIATYQDFIATSFAGFRFFVTHDLGSPYRIKKQLQRTIQHYAPHVIIFGHTHTPHAAYVSATLYFNPGSSSQGRAGKPKSVGVIEVTDSRPVGKILPLTG